MNAVFNGIGITGGNIVGQTGHADVQIVVNEVVFDIAVLVLFQAAAAADGVDFFPYPAGSSEINDIPVEKVMRVFPGVVAGKLKDVLISKHLPVAEEDPGRTEFIGYGFTSLHLYQ